MTATDIVVARGMAPGVGDPSLVAGRDPDLVSAAYNRIVGMIEDAIDAMKTSAGDVPVILVGGGSILSPRVLTGASEVLCPSDAGVANAIGSAIAQVSGQVNKVYSLAEVTREEAIETSKRLACEEAVAAGADPESVKVIDVEDIPMAYLGDALSIRVKAVGDLAL